jgi:hypothetical protein
MEFFLVITIIFGLGFFLGWRLREQIAIKRIQEVTEEIADDVLEEFKSKVIDIYVEDHEGTFFLYKREDGAYLAHGPTMEKLEDILMEKFPGKLFNAKPDDLEKLKSR